MTFDQARALIHAMQTSPKVVSHLESALGFGHVPTAEHFDSTVPETIDKCLEALSYLDDALGILRVVLEHRPKQPDMLADAAKLPEEIEVEPADETDPTVLILRKDLDGIINALAVQEHGDDCPDSLRQITCAPSFALLRERLIEAGYTCKTDWLDPQTGPVLLVVGVRQAKKKYVEHNLHEVPGGYALIPTANPVGAAFAGISVDDLRENVARAGFECQKFDALDIPMDEDTTREAS